VRLLRWLGWTVLVALGLAVVALAAAVVWRVPLAQWALPRVLEAQGLAGGAEVEALGLHRLVLLDVAVADASARRVVVDYAPAGLIDGRIEAVSLSGLTVPVDLTGQGPPLGGLQSLLDSSGGGGSQSPQDLSTLPAVVVDDARFPLKTPEGPVMVRAEGRFAPQGPEPGFVAKVDAGWHDLTLSGKAEGTIADGRIAAVEGGFDLTDAQQRGHLTGQVSTDLDAGQPAVSVTLDGTAQAALATFLAPFGVPAVSDGSADLHLTLDAPLPSAEQQAQILDDPAAALGLPWTAEGRIAADGLTLPSLAGGVNARATFTTALADGRRRLSLDGPAIVRAESLDPTLGLPKPFDAGAALVVLRLALSVDPAEPTAGGFDLAAVAHATGPGRVVVTGSGKVAADGAVEASPLNLVAVDLPLPGREEVVDLAYRGAATHSAEGFSLTADHPVQVAVRNLVVGPVRSDRLAAEVTGFALEGEAATDGWAFRPAGTVVLERSALRLEREGAPPLPFSIGPSRLELHDLAFAKGRLTGGLELESAARSSGLPLDLADLSISADFQRLDRVTLHLDGARLTPSVAGLPPLRLSGVVEVDAPKIDIAAKATALNGELTIALQGGHDLDSGRGRVRADLRPETFTPGGLQPAQVLPALAPLQQALGTLKADATFAWTEGGVSSNGTVSLDGTSFVAGGVSVNGMALDLDLRSLWPVDSPPGQSLTVESIDAGVPLTEVATRFQLQPRRDGAPNLLLEQGAATFAGGRLRLEQGVINPIDGRYRLTLGAERLDLEALTDLLALPSLSASGQLSGTLPITIDGDSVVIRDGKFSTEGPGRLHFESPGARAALAQGGDTVELMLDALEDFHYDELSMTVNKPASGESEVALHLKGNNPKVLDGRQFNLNLNLTGNLDPILAALAEGQRLSDDVLSQLWRLGR